MRKSMFRVFLAVLLFAASSLAKTATLQYEIVEVLADGKTKLLAAGNREYSIKDIRTEEKQSKDRPHWSKSLALEKGFSIGASVYRDEVLKGFGLWGEMADCKSFSWEWFNLKEAGVFEKLQERGQVSVSYRGLPMYEEIGEITFDTDISFRINNSTEIGKVTHRILVKKGSQLVLLP